MNLFAGNFCAPSCGEMPDLDFDIIRVGKNSFFIMGGTEDFHNVEDCVIFLETYFGKILSYDISFEGEDELEVITTELEEGSDAYECVSFEGPFVAFSEIIERFAESSELICVRESGVSEKFGNKIVKADFFY